LQRLLFITLLGIAAIAFAEGPGSRLLTTPEQPKPGASKAPDKKQKQPRAENPSPDRPGPEATGGGTNAGTGASSGTSGASSASGGAR